MLPILLMAFAVQSKPRLANSAAHYNTITDSVRKKITHPTVAMTDAQLNTILNLMRQKTNDADKITVLKVGLTGKGIMVEQLTQLLNQFLTDDSKLECAEYAFQFTVNYKTYSKLDDLFASEDTKAGLDDFVKKNK